MFLDSLETFQSVRKLSKLSGNFPDCQKTFQTIRKLFKLSGNFLDCPETFQTVWKLSRQSGNFLTDSTFQASFYVQFCINKQKISCRQCRHVDEIFGTLHRLPRPVSTVKPSWWKHNREQQEGWDPHLSPLMSQASG